MIDGKLFDKLVSGPDGVRIEFTVLQVVTTFAIPIGIYNLLK